jgi:hypothetical protein
MFVLKVVNNNHCAPRGDMSYDKEHHIIPADSHNYHDEQKGKD